MTDLFASLAEAYGEPAGPKFPRSGQDRIVRVTPDYLRIQRLPRRDWRAAPELPQLVRLLTQHCKTPHGQQELRPVQAAALREIHDCGGGFLPIRVGGGKTLISLLAPLVLSGHPRCAGGVRAILVVPAALREKTQIEARRLALHWKIPPIKVLTYEFVSRQKVGWLAEHDVNLVIFDECHKLKNSTTGVTKQVRSLFRKRHPIGVFMSGSITARGIRDYGHLLTWALGLGAPLPKDPFERLMWSYALDEKIDAENRAEPGPLEELYTGRTAHGAPVDASGAGLEVPAGLWPANVGEGADALTRARDAYRRRLVSTPGVITTAEDIPACGLTLTATELTPGPELVEAIRTMRDTWCTPDDHPFETPIELWTHAGEMAGGGFYHVWDPRPPLEWIEARRAWSKFCRGALSASRSMGTPSHVIDAILRGQIDDGGLWAEWSEIKPTFKPNSVPRPIDDAAIQYAADWLRRMPSGKAVCFVPHRYTGRRLAELTRLPYFSRKAQDEQGRYIGNCETSCIASIFSVKEGHNLQQFCHNLIMSPPSIGSLWEQALGRTHRDGQEADEVTVEVLLVVREQYEAWLQGARDAEQTWRTTGTPQKLIYADKDDAWTIAGLEARILRGGLL